jgi:hypothetical protein
LIALGRAVGLGTAMTGPSLAQSSTHRHHARVPASSAQPANPQNAGNSFGAAQHAGQCWIPTGGGMNPNAKFGYWGDCSTKGSLPNR